MKSKLLTKKASLSEILAKYDAIQVSAADVTLNDDLVHNVVIVSDKGNIAGIMIKDLDSDSDGIVIEKNFFEQFVNKVRDAWVQVRVLDQDLREEESRK